ncbi:penicillin-binding transpeptidase domain-containing protein [Saccharothrix coeruleofusca]|uniref:Penicillin-binding protein n=1 Tax=Saccharothrix coeruleofusca TaxID=33919 RepID=A0A918ALC3_9PSEU|nr:penicillin-binding transpeptidase domain-containing protein [Saccharothrix coeruleofusca]MBP2338489.1 cell division protein FtsI/penicillin-binding protein 2 [Saccharothrix coeruleofusca]GGP48056.1 penicillin-binding protein [Saccharothrix coeruleofusca]
MILRKLAGLSCALVLVAGCGLFSSGPGPDEVARDFLARWSGGDLDGAAALTDDPAAAKELLAKVHDALKPVKVAHSLDQVRSAGEDTAAGATAKLDWTLAHDRSWNYRAEFELRRDAEDWKVRWAPSVVHPKLAAQQGIGLTEVQPDLAPVLDRDGTPLLAPEQVVSVLLDRKEAGDLNAVATALAGALNPIDESITPQSIAEGAGKVPEGQVYQVAALRDADYQSVKPRIYELPGVRFTTRTSLLAPSRDFGSQVLPAVRKAVEEEAAGLAGLRVYTVNAAGGEVETLHEERPQPAEAVTTALSRTAQAAAEDALEPVQQPAMLVAIQPSSGDVLAVAQNAAADAQGAIALTGNFPPGSTFKIVTAAAAMAAGKAGADSPLPCPGKTTIDGRRVVPNDKEFDKGTIPLRSAFAFSCNTTFAQLAAELPADALTSAADSFGLGVDFEVPAITTITGSVPPATDVVERAEDGFGQGKVLASPFGMALVAATAARGAMPTPNLLRGQETKVDHQPAAPPPAVLEPLRAMMREVVEYGTATQLRDLGDVRGKTGTAQFGDGTNSHGWFVGYRGDVAFATLLLGTNASTPAVDATGRFLRALG